MNLRRLLPLILVVLVLAFGALSLYWHWSAQRLEIWIAAWVQDQRAQGYEISYQDPEIGGYPFHLTAYLAAPRMASPEGWVWQAKDVEAQAFLLDPFTIEVDFAGQHQVEQQRGGAARDIEVRFAEARSIIHLARDGSLDRGELDLLGAVVQADGVAPLSIGQMGAQLGPIEEARSDRPQAILLKADLSDIELPPNERNPLGSDIDLLAFDLLLLGQLSEGDPRSVVEAWRRSGGQLDIKALALEWGALGLLAEGAVALDDQLRPLGTIQARVAGFAETLAALSGAGLIAP